MTNSLCPDKQHNYLITCRHLSTFFRSFGRWGETVNLSVEKIVIFFDRSRRVSGGTPSPGLFLSGVFARRILVRPFADSVFDSRNKGILLHGHLLVPSPYNIYVHVHASESPIVTHYIFARRFFCGLHRM